MWIHPSHPLCKIQPLRLQASRLEFTYQRSHTDRTIGDKKHGWVLRCP